MMPVDVCAGVVLREGELLLATRPHGTHLAGKWEFPGGKVHGGESLHACIRRELHEELGLSVEDSQFLLSLVHHYPGKSVQLHFLWCTVPEGSVVVCREGQQVGWFAPAAVSGMDLAPADRAFVRRLEGLSASAADPVALSETGNPLASLAALFL